MGLLLFFLPDWTDHWVSGAAGGGAALVAAVGVSFVTVLAFEVGFSGDGGADMIVLYCIVHLGCLFPSWRIYGCKRGFLG